MFDVQTATLNSTSYIKIIQKLHIVSTNKSWFYNLHITTYCFNQ